MLGLQRVHTEVQLESFIKIWDKVHSSVLSNNPDLIEWKPDKKGKYSAKSAYEFQFRARIQQPHLGRTWTIRAEGKN